MKEMKKSTVIIIFTAVLVAIAAVVVFGLDRYGVISVERIFKQKYELSFSLGEKGTAVIPEGKTVAVSVFVTADEYSWHDEDSDDKEMQEQLEYLAVATDWISSQAQRYGKKIQFVYDWQADTDLFYDARIKHSMLVERGSINDGYNYLWDYINNNIPSQELVDRYNANNIVYLVYYDTDASNRINPFTNDAYFHNKTSYDICMLPTVYSKGKLRLSSAVVAHEILHLFGSPDLYEGRSARSNYGVDDEFVQYSHENLPNDIMLSTFEHDTNTMFFDSIPREITDITAYYIGWLEERPEVIDEYGLDYSQHDPDREAQIAKKYADIL